MSFQVITDLRRFADEDSDTIGRDVLRRKLHQFADRMDEIIAYYSRCNAQQAGIMDATVVSGGARCWKERSMKASENETVADALEAISELATKLYEKENAEKYGIKDVWSIVQQVKNRIEAAHRRDREDARRRAERSAIYNMLESFPHDWGCNPDAVRKWMTAWYKNADDLCEGGPYAE